MAQLNFDFENHSDEQKLFMAVLYTYFEDVDTIYRQRVSPRSSHNSMYRNDRPEISLHTLYSLIREEHTVMICDLINLDHSFFVYKWKDYVWQVLSERI